MLLSFFKHIFSTDGDILSKIWLMRETLENTLLKGKKFLQYEHPLYSSVQDAKYTLHM